MSIIYDNGKVPLKRKSAYDKIRNIERRERFFVILVITLLSILVISLIYKLEIETRL